MRRLAVRLLGLHFAFGVVKLAGYAEQEALTFMAVDALLLALLAAPLARRWFT